MNSNEKTFESLVRTYIITNYPDRAPTEEELTNACEIMRAAIPLSDDSIKAIIRKLKTVLDISLDLGVSIEKDYEPWLNAKKNSIDFYYWNRYELYLQNDMQRSANVIAAIDKVSDKVVDLLGNPENVQKRRGLLLGDIQSGKTANYLAIMNKAADVGYKVIILLTGTVESLRRQTQERVDEGFIGRSSKAYLQRNSQTIIKGVGRHDSRHFAVGFTTESSDFRTAVVNSTNASLKNFNDPIVFVMKKNASALRNLYGWLKDNNTDSNGKIDRPLLLIDDEADNASINTRQDDSPTTINKYIRDILSLFTTSSYMGVTATPFANIFIDPDKNEDMDKDDLFPSDFIYALDSPSNYIGSNELFGEEAEFSSALMPIDDADHYFPYKHPKDLVIDALPPSLYEALRYFLLFNVARDIDGATTSHRSMMINVSRFVKVQQNIAELVEAWLYEMKRDIKHYSQLDEKEACKNGNISDLRHDWCEESSPFLKYDISWESVQKKYLLAAINSIEVRTINQKSSVKLDYTEYAETGLRVIAVGGLGLSRGLTLEGLAVSYFHRNTQMYDTLMQMGRWFGYRDDYRDLFRIWMPDDAVSWYSHITNASNELREEISTMNRLGATPKDFGLRVRAHPTSLIITARNKMRRAERIECFITLDGEFFETPRFKNDINVIRRNKQRTDNLICEIIDRCGLPKPSGRQPYFWNNVPKDLVCDYVRSYENHYLNTESDGKVLEKYINDNEKFETWDVLLFNGDAPAIEVGELYLQPTTRPIFMKNKILSVYGGKMRIGTVGLTRHGLTQHQIELAKNRFKEAKRPKYVEKYGDLAEEKLAHVSIPDKAYLIPERDHPIIIIHYLSPNFSGHEDSIPEGFVLGQDLLVGYGMGFPAFSGSQARYAIYYINPVEQRSHFEEELEEDQLDDDNDNVN